MRFDVGGLGTDQSFGHPANGSLVIEDIISLLGGDDSAGGIYLRAEAITGDAVYTEAR